MIENTVEFLAISAYSISVILLAIYALHAGILTIIAATRKTPSSQSPNSAPFNWPDVTVQIPIRNEHYVVRRVIESVAALDYPRDKLHIQVLDDSNDDTTDIARMCAHRLEIEGFNIEVIHRSQPQGYKAGALSNAQPDVVGDFIALFDADFVPGSDYLKCTLPVLLSHPDVAIVQTRWTHLNVNQNTFTRVQALGLDAHFLIDQRARNASGLLMNFNGAGGIWRKQAIIDAGGWSDDTLTEDLDLSYRAQLKGWRMIYLSDVTVGEELPTFFDAVKAQQRRWAKGSAQCLRKLAVPILVSRDLSMAQKLFALLHLSGYFSQLALFCTLLLSLPLSLLPQSRLPFWYGIAGTIATISAAMYYLSSQLISAQGKNRQHIKIFFHYPLLLALGLSTSLNISLALFDGLFHRGGRFVRTAKYDSDIHNAPAKGYSEPEVRSPYTTEWISFAYALLVIVAAVLTGHFQFIHSGVAYIAAYALIALLDLKTRTAFFSNKKRDES